jgi:hypothetical protein
MKGTMTMTIKRNLLASLAVALILLTTAAMAVRSASANTFWARNVPTDAFNTLVTLRDNGHTIKSVAFAPNGGWVVFYDFNGALAKNIPATAFNKIVAAQNAGHELHQFSFAPDSGWAFTFGYNGVWMSGPTGALSRVQQLQSAGKAIKEVSLGPNGSWVVRAGNHTFFTSGIPSALQQKLTDIYLSGSEPKNVALGPGGAWMVNWNFNGAWVAGSATLLAKVIEVQKAGRAIVAAAFTPTNGGWVLPIN